MADFKDTMEFEGIECSVDSNDAVLVVIEEEEYWIPKSQIDDRSEVYKKGTEGKLIISRWIAEKKGLDDE